MTQTNEKKGLIEKKTQNISKEDLNYLFNLLYLTIWILTCWLSTRLLIKMVKIIDLINMWQVVITPISCNHDQTPVISVLQLWALGALLAKISTALILTGPQWWLREAIDTICQHGFRDVNLKYIFAKVFYPVMVCSGLALAIPCILSRSVAPLLVEDEATLLLVERRIYPSVLCSCTLLGLFLFQVRQFRRLYERIRNDKYLVGQRLINFERSLNGKWSSPAASADPTTG